MKIGLHYSTTANNNGPGKVAQNLIKGLHSLNIEVVPNEICEYNGILQLNCKNIYNAPLNSFIGPNISVLPTEAAEVWKRYNSFNVPCQWVYDFYSLFEITKNKSMHIWPVGIDTEKFCDLNQTKKYDVLIYCKNTKDKLPHVENFLKQLGLTYTVLVYGQYNEDEFIFNVNASKCAILLTKTESQGIAYQEILSMGVPCYVINKPVWDDYGIDVPASSVPYFDENCGIVEHDSNKFELFYNNIFKYNPRKYILDNLNLKKQAFSYVELIKGKIYVDELI
jgi:hypothetical protein